MILFSILSFLILACLVFYTLIQNRKNFLLLAIIIPLTVFGIGYSWFVIEEFKGYPTANLPDKAQVLKIHKSKPWIYLLLDTDKGPRLYVVPWTEKNKKEGEKAQQALEEGQIIIFEPTKHRNEADIKFYKWDHKRSFPKSE